MYIQLPLAVNKHFMQLSLHIATVSSINYRKYIYSSVTNNVKWQKLYQRLSHFNIYKIIKVQNRIKKNSRNNHYRNRKKFYIQGKTSTLVIIYTHFSSSYKNISQFANHIIAGILVLPQKI